MSEAKYKKDHGIKGKTVTKKGVTYFQSMSDAMTVLNRVKKKYPRADAHLYKLGYAVQYYYSGPYYPELEGEKASVKEKIESRLNVETAGAVNLKSIKDVVGKVARLTKSKLKGPFVESADISGQTYISCSLETSADMLAVVMAFSTDQLTQAFKPVGSLMPDNRNKALSYHTSNAVIILSVSKFKDVEIEFYVNN